MGLNFKYGSKLEAFDKGRVWCIKHTANDCALWGEILQTVTLSSNFTGAAIGEELALINPLSSTYSLFWDLIIISSSLLYI